MIGVDSGWFSTIALIVGGGGIAGAVAVIVKLRPEKDALTITLSEKAVIVQSNVIESLTDDNQRLKTRVADLEAVVNSFAEMRTRIAALETERRLLRMENAGLKERVQMLESEVAGLRGPLTDETGSIIERREEP